MPVQTTLPPRSSTDPEAMHARAPGAVLAVAQQPVAGAGPEQAASAAVRPVEIGGPTGPEPTRFGDWEKSGRCIDF